MVKIMVCYYSIQFLQELQEIARKKKHTLWGKYRPQIQYKNYSQYKNILLGIFFLIELIQTVFSICIFQKNSQLLSKWFWHNHPSFLLFSPTQTAPINFDIHYKNHPTTFQFWALKYNVFSPLLSRAYVHNFLFISIQNLVQDRSFSYLNPLLSFSGQNHQPILVNSIL